ncbi:MAG TPA: transcriptional regulator [Clostridiales bacterium]|nr:MAG: transcriptional regulator [Clostridiales bacterium GWD2_32_59]HAN10611.1 transcriptional regulator [Clostridiales bacterium]
MRESNRVEFKRELNDKLEKEVVGFLNYHEGGVIYIGVDDDYNPVELFDVDSLQLKIADRIKNNILPSTLGLFDIVKEELEGKPIIKVVISSGTEKPYYIRSFGMSPTGCYIRIGSATQPMTTDNIDELYSRRVRNSLKKIPSPRQDLTFNQLKIYYEEHKLKLNNSFAQNLNLLTEDGRYNYNAYLLADENNLPIRVVKYLGTTKKELIENQDYGNRCLITATNRILDKFESENKVFAKIGYPYREEKQMISRTAFREALINAVVHNDYSNGGTPIVEFYSDRVEITSTGGLPLGLSQEEFLRGITFPRNQDLIRVFKDVDLIENIGSGVLRILEEYDKTCFEFMEHFLRVSFKYRENTFEYDNDKKAHDTENDTENDTVKEEVILKLLQADKKISANKIAKETGYGIATVKRYITKLKDAKAIKRVGPDKGGYWEIIDDKK